jgi:hypothetical protein
MSCPILVTCTWLHKIDWRKRIRQSHWSVSFSFFCGATVQLGPRPPDSSSLCITHTHTGGRLCTSDQLVAQAATCITHNKHKRRKTMPSAGLFFYFRLFGPSVFLSIRGPFCSYCPCLFFMHCITHITTALLAGGSRDWYPVLSLGIFSEATDGTRCPGVDSASKNEYQDTPGGKDGRCVRVTTLPPLLCRKSRKSGSLNFPDPCSGKTLPLTYITQTSMPSPRFEPATPVSDRPQTLALDRSATNIGLVSQLRWS